MPDRTRAYYREFIRLRCLIKTPREAWMEAVAMGWEHEDECPPYGAQPSWQVVPSNYLLNSVIDSACQTVLRKCRVMNALRFTDLTIPATTNLGPQIFRLDGIPGNDGGVIRIRRAYWNDGADANSTWNPLLPVYLAQQDVQLGNYMNDGPGTPYQIAIEGELVYLIPGTGNGGTLRLTIGNGVLAPETDEEGYDGIPEAYDDAINYVALSELAAVLAGDAEMQKRLAVFAPFAADGLREIDAWFDNAALDTLQPSANFSTSISRYVRAN